MKYALSIAMFCLLLSSPGQAATVESGPVLICDTQEQVEQVVQLFDGNQELAINAVNAKQQNPEACGVVNAAYVLGPQLGVARNRSYAFEISPIVVVGVTTTSGYRPLKPSLYFTLVN